MVAMLILVGIALYFWFAPSSPPAAPPGVRRSERHRADHAARRQRAGRRVRHDRAGGGRGHRRRARPRGGGRQGGRRHLGSRPADRAGRLPGHPHRPRSRGARGVAPLGRPRPRHRGARSLPRAPASASGRPSRTASTTTSRCRARSRPRTSSGSRPKMGEVAKADYPFVREVVDRDAANRRFADDPLKLERISELGDDETISVYTDGPFTDLCRGPHIPADRPAQAFQAAPRRRRLLAGRREAADAPADLRHRLVQEGGPGRLPPPPGGGAQARPSGAGAAARSLLHLRGGRARAWCCGIRGVPRSSGC